MRMGGNSVESNDGDVIRAVVFDVGETLVDETRMWTALATSANVQPLTLFAVLGSMIERGIDHRRLWSELGVRTPDITHRLEPSDLYPDALPCLNAVRNAGYLVGIAGNQPAGVCRQLETLGFEADFIASSAEWGVEKPDPEYFDRIIDATRMRPSQILYVGDRVDNDIIPAHRAGMTTAFLLRGPWAHIHTRRPEVALADLTVNSLDDLERVLTGDDVSQSH